MPFYFMLFGNEPRFMRLLTYFIGLACKASDPNEQIKVTLQLLEVATKRQHKLIPLEKKFSFDILRKSSQGTNFVSFIIKVQSSNRVFSEEALSNSHLKLQ